MKTENGAASREIGKFRKLAREAVRHHFGAFPKRIVSRSGGLSNFVFSFSNPDGEFVIRISPDPARINSFIKEQWAEHAARTAGIPTPRILEVGFELLQLPYMISHSVAGTEATHHPKRLEILREMGRYAALINTIRTTGFRPDVRLVGEQTFTQFDVQGISLSGVSIRGKTRVAKEK